MARAGKTLKQTRTLEHATTMKVFQQRANYKADIVFRVYYNQLGTKAINQNPSTTFCFEVLNHKHAQHGSNMGGCYQCEHPQGVKEAWLQLLNEMRGKDVVIQFSDECDYNEGLWLGVEFNPTLWFQNMYEWTTKEPAS